MKKTVLNQSHIALGAKMVPFAGFEMPLEYSGITSEHLCVRNEVGVFDVSHMGEFWVKGPKALDFVQKVTSNDASVLEIGKIQYSCFPNGKGGIVDDLLVYKYADEKYLLVVNAGNIDKDWEWCNSQNSMGAILENASDATSQLAIQGPKAVALLQTLTSVDLSKIPYYTFTTGDFAGISDVIISNTGYTGAGGFELYFYNKDVKQAWDALLKAGDAFGLKPIGLGARDTLRLEMGYCLYGNDINDTTSPIEASLGWITKFTDSKNFVDKDLLLKQKTEGVTRKLVGFKMKERAIPRHDYEVVDANGNVIGVVTSGTMSPVLQQGVGMGYVKPEFSKIGSEIFIKIRNKSVAAEVVKMPFLK
ncbi:MAG: glycine cleavage system aminomethyltransferase GcvT [Breznakibacter sp.]|nr:glycine cleavage system aminomethyltransferase GcvT [Breznakibacter sp.]